MLAGDFSAAPASSVIPLADSLVLAAVDRASPQVIGVSVSGNNWSDEARAGGHRIPLGSSSQLAPLPWAAIDQIMLEFNEPVSISADDLTIRGTTSEKLAVQQFFFEQGSTRAVWRLETPLATDRYLLELADSATDTAGNRLDGEWSDGSTSRSGNGLAGGDFKFQFLVQTGDVDQDGKTSVRDHGEVFARLGSTRGSAEYDLLFDLNVDNVIDANDLDTIIRSFEVRQPLGDQVTGYHIAVLDDASNQPELAVLRGDSRPQVLIVDANNGERIRDLTLNPNFSFLGLNTVNDETGRSVGLAVLGIHMPSGGARLWTWNSGNADFAHSIALGRALIPLEVECFLDSSGAAKVALLGRNLSSSVWSIRVFDLATGVYERSINLGGDFRAIDLEVAASVSSDQKLLTVLGIVESTGGTRAKIYDSRTHSQVANLSFGKGANPIALKVIQREAALEVGVLLVLKANGRAVFKTMDVATGGITQALRFPAANKVVGFTLWRSVSDGIDYVAVATQEPQSHYTTVMTRTLNGESAVSQVSFGAGFEFLSVAPLALPGDAANDLALAVLQFDRPEAIAQIKIKRSDGSRVRTIPLSAAQPSWYEANRVHGHTRLSFVDPRLGLDRSWFQTPQSEQAARAFRDLGAKVFTRHAKASDEDPWWPSELPVDDNQLVVLREGRDNQGIFVPPGANFIQPLINEAAREGLPIMLYYFEATESSLAEAHPEWVARNSRGEIIEHAYKGKYLDITGPYGDIVVQRFLELADMGADGIYLDFTHLPLGGIWGTQLARDFELETGKPAPLPSNRKDYEEFLDFIAIRLEQTIGGWEHQLHAQYPHVQLVVSVTSVPALTRREMTTGLVKFGAPKSEFDVATRPGLNFRVFERNPELLQPEKDVQMAFGFTLLRDSAEGVPPHVWNAFMPNGEHVLAFVSGVTTYGGVAALDVPEELLAADGYLDGIASRDDLAAGFQLGNQISPHLQGMSAVKWVAVHFSEQSRNARGNDYAAAWRESIWPSVGAFQVLQESGKPVGIINDRQLADGALDGYQVLFLPTPRELSPAQSAAVAAFVAEGGTVIENDPSWDWSTAAGNPLARQSLTNVLAAQSAPPLEVFGLPDGVHAVSYQSGEFFKISVALANDFSWVQQSTIFDPIPSSEVNTAPPPVPAGIVINLHDSLNANLSSIDENKIYAYEAVSGQRLNVVRVSDGFRLEVPGFDYMALVTIEASGP